MNLLGSAMRGRWIWRGMSGRAYGFTYDVPLATLPEGPGVFILAAHGEGMPRALFVGESTNLAEALRQAETIVASACWEGLTHIHVLETASDDSSQAAIKADLLHRLAPKLNLPAPRGVLPASDAAGEPAPRRPGWGMDLLTGDRPLARVH